MKSVSIKVNDPWDSLKKFTPARIAIGRVGSSVPLKQALELKLAQAHARDAVYSTLNSEILINDLQYLDIPILELHSKAENRQQYLQRPDLGRQLNDTSIQIIKENAGVYDICIIIADGLSANAINNNSIQLMEALIPLFKAMKFKLAPICLAEQARVALADHIANGLKAKLSLILIGERPGLSAIDSIGAYITYNPTPGFTDESRNCVSNIRQDGLSFKLAAEKIFFLVQEAFKRQLSGINLKDNTGLLGE
jgi:ethanolamine ammonia-lyase small subunit